MNVDFGKAAQEVPMGKPAVPQEMKTQDYLLALLKTPMDTPYVVFVPLGKGHAVLARIRVQWSRVKAILKKKNVTPKDFKILSDVRMDVEGNRDRLQMTKSMNGKMEFDLSELRELAEILK